MKIEDYLTTLRIFMAPVVMALIFKGDAVAALFVYIAAASTDALDGYFARKRKKHSKKGEIFDALADFTLFYFTAFSIAIIRPSQKFTLFVAFTIVIISSLMYFAEC